MIFYSNRSVITDAGWGRLAQRITFCQEQELDLENEVSPTVAQPPETLFLPTSTTLLTQVHTENDSRVYFMIVLTTDYCWRSWTCRIAAPYRFYVDWLIDWLIEVYLQCPDVHPSLTAAGDEQQSTGTERQWRHCGHVTLQRPQQLRLRILNAATARLISHRRHLATNIQTVYTNRLLDSGSLERQD